MIYVHNNHSNQPYHGIDSSHQTLPLLKYIILTSTNYTSVRLQHVLGKCFLEIVNKVGSVLNSLS